MTSGRGRGGWGPPRPGGGPFGPRGGRGGGRAKRGDIRLATLLLLAEAPRNGYAIMQVLEERTDGVWRPSPGAVYPALNQLQDEGLVSAEEAGGKRTFSLTEEGRAHVAGLGDATPPWEAVTKGVDEEAFALVRLLRGLAHAVHQVGEVGTPDQVEDARKVLVQARKDLYALLARDDET